MNPLIQPKNASPLILIALLLACLPLSPRARAVVPAPDGGYPGSNTAEGDNALLSLTIGNSNTANGANALLSNTTGSANTATGSDALRLNTTGGNNTANGFLALNANTTGSYNTANGVNALQNNSTGASNTAIGQGSLFSNTDGQFNTASGVQALNDNTSGVSNTANGAQALFSNTTGSYNMANGVLALFGNKTGKDNTASGASALNHNTGGSHNTAAGEVALFNNTTGSNNTALGFVAGENLTTGNNNIDIGANVFGVAGESNTIRIGKVGTQTRTFIAAIHGATVSGSAAVFVSSSGQLGTAPSSKRFKDEIKPMDKASEAILALKPVTFRYKKELDPDSVPQFGLVAEEVEKVSRDLVARDAEGKVYTVRYEAVNAMLLNEFLKEHRKVKELEANTARQQQQIETLTAGLQKVSAQLEASKPARQVVNNP